MDDNSIMLQDATAIPITAPRFTEDDKLREQESLSESELVQIAADLFGSRPTSDSGTTKLTPAPTMETPEMTARALSRLEAEIDSIDATEKASYTQALMVAPRVVEKESNPVFFLRRESFNAKSAAYRLVRYWSMRHKIFGENAFLPMRQTGHGALTPNDIENLRLGSVMLLPSDMSGRPILYTDRSRLYHLANMTTTMLRNLFYFHTVIMENPAAAEKGCVSICNVTNVDYRRFDCKFCRNAIRLLHGSFLVESRSIHFCCGAKRAVFNLFLPLLLPSAGRYFRQRTVFHCGSGSDLVDSMAEYGLVAEDIPVRVGGKWCIRDFTEWLDARLEFERNLDEQDAEAMLAEQVRAG